METMLKRLRNLLNKFLPFPVNSGLSKDISINAYFEDIRLSAAPGSDFDKITN